MATMNELAGTLVPTTCCPMARPVAVLTVRVGWAAAPEAVMPVTGMAPMVSGVAAPTAVAPMFTLSVIVFVAALMAVMNALAGTLVPVTCWPSERPATEESVMVG